MRTRVKKSVENASRTHVVEIYFLFSSDTSQTLKKRLSYTKKKKYFEKHGVCLGGEKKREREKILRVCKCEREKKIERS